MAEVMLTKHFMERWMERVGNWPTQEGIAHFIRHSVKVQGGMNVVKDGKPFRLLAIYWHPDLDIVIKVDEDRWAAVTVLSRELWTKGRFCDSGLIMRPNPLSPPSPVKGEVALKGLGRSGRTHGSAPTGKSRSAMVARIARIKSAFGMRHLKSQI